MILRIASTIAIRIIGAAAAFGLGMVLARRLGSADFGVYSYMLTIVMLVQIPVVRSLPNLVTRYVALYHHNSRVDLLRGLIRQCLRFALLLSVGLVIVGALAGAALLGDFGSERLTTLLVGLLLLPTSFLLAITEGSLRGLGHTQIGQLPSTLMPVIFLVIVVVEAVTVPGGASARDVMIINVLASTLAVVAGFLWLRGRLPQSVSNVWQSFERREWLTSIAPLVGIALGNLVAERASFLVLGAVRPIEEAGIYQAAINLSGLVIFGLYSASVTLAPVVVRLKQEADMEGLQRAVSQACRASLLFGLPILIILVFFASLVLQYAYGGEFAAGRDALIILAFGQFINAATGPAGTVLVMIGCAGKSFSASAFGAIVNILLALALIPSFSLVGAAIATTCALTLLNMIALGYLRKATGVWALPFGFKGIEWKAQNIDNR